MDTSKPFWPQHKLPTINEALRELAQYDLSFMADSSRTAFEAKIQKVLNQARFNHAKNAGVNLINSCPDGTRPLITHVLGTNVKLGRGATNAVISGHIRFLNQEWEKAKKALSRAEDVLERVRTEEHEDVAVAYVTNLNAQVQQEAALRAGLHKDGRKAVWKITKGKKNNLEWVRAVRDMRFERTEVKSLPGFIHNPGDEEDKAA